MGFGASLRAFGAWWLVFIGRLRVQGLGPRVLECLILVVGFWASGSDLCPKGQGLASQALEGAGLVKDLGGLQTLNP